MKPDLTAPQFSWWDVKLTLENANAYFKLRVSNPQSGLLHMNLFNIFKNKNPAVFCIGLLQTCRSHNFLLIMNSIKVASSISAISDVPEYSTIISIQQVLDFMSCPSRKPFDLTLWIPLGICPCRNPSFRKGGKKPLLLPSSHTVCETDLSHS